MSLRAGGFCRRGRHLLAESDIGTSSAKHRCLPCHRDFMRRKRGRMGCAVCDRAVRVDAPRGLCDACRPEIAFLDALYAVVATSTRTLLETCPVGHPYDVANTLVLLRRTPIPWIARHCRLCIASNKRRARRRAKVQIIRALMGELEQAA